MNGFSAVAQYFPSQVWHEGEVVLVAGDTLKGEIMYSQETDLVQVKPTFDKSRILALSGRKLLSVEIYDKTSGVYRNFYALPYSLNPGYKTPILFEIIFTGTELSLLSRETIENQLVNYPYSAVGTYSRQILDYTYYFLKSDGSISEFYGKKRDLIWAMNNRAPQIKKFIKTNKIRPDRRNDILKVIRYYNSLFNNSKNTVN